MSESKPNKKLFIAAILLVLATLLSGLVFRPEKKRLFESFQPKHVHYDATYVLRVLEGRSILHFPFMDHRYSYIIEISRSGDGEGYRHRVELDVPGSDVSKNQIEWVLSGIEIRLNSGHRLFIPERAFTGGR